MGALRHLSELMTGPAASFFCRCVVGVDGLLSVDGAGDMARGVCVLEAKGVLPVFAVGVEGRWVLCLVGERVEDAVAERGEVGAKVKVGPR
jgi:hypothetical protein